MFFVTAKVVVSIYSGVNFVSKRNGLDFVPRENPSSYVAAEEINQAMPFENFLATSWSDEKTRIYSRTDDESFGRVGKD